MTPRFRPTAWPGGEVPLPPVPVWGNLRVHDDLWIELMGPPREIELPPDFALRELSAERPTTPDAAVAFVRRWGRASDPDNRDLPPGWADHFVAPPATVLERERSRLGHRLGLDDGEALRRLVHPVEVLTRAQIMGDLTARFIRLCEEGDADEDSWTLFANFLNAALSAFPAHLDIEGVNSRLTIPPATAFSVAALQLLNDVAAKTPLRHCGNERCPHGGVYTRQRGRAQYGEYRTLGTKYCSRECAKSQAAREHRRRAKRSRGAA